MPISSKNLCLHKRFHVGANINYLEDVKRWIADISIQCEDCREKFRFVGVPSGFNALKPMSSIDGLELRAPIEPQGDTVMLATRSAFHVPAKKIDRDQLEQTLASMRQAARCADATGAIVQLEAVFTWIDEISKAILEDKPS